MSVTSLGKVAFFIDGANLHATGKALGFKIDFRRLLNAFQNDGALIRAYYYTAVDEEEDRSPSIRPLLDWLEYNGYAVVMKAKKSYTDVNGCRKFKGNIEVNLAVHAMEMTRHVDQIVLFSGDRAFCPLVVAVQRRGVRVSVVSSISCEPPMIASDLRRQADAFVDLKDLRCGLGQ